MAKKIKKSQILRHCMQVIMFLLLPGLYAMTFSELRTVYEMIIKGNFNFLQALPSLVEFVAVMFLTIIAGRWFCGWMCAFGAYNDLIYFISKKIFKSKFKVNEKVDSILKYAKYVVLIFIIIISWTIGSNILESTSPWDVFGQITNISTVISNLLIGLVLLALITIGAFFVERFFCRYLCPLGAVFSIISKIGITKINKPKADCGKCRACTINCSMGLQLYKVDKVKGGDCINCLKCTEVCPRNNANANILGQDLNAALTGSVAMAAMLGVYGFTNFGVDALTKAGIISNDSAVSSSEASNDLTAANASQKYKDGTYTGSGQGFNGGTTKVSITIADGKISKIDILSNGDDHQYFERACGIITKEILSKQSSDVDIVSGATYSSKGIISAVKDALRQASNTDSDSDTSNNSNETKDQVAASAPEASSKDKTSSDAGDSVKVTASKFKDGTYTGTGTGFEGGTTKMSVTIANGKMTSIKTLSYGDTPEFYQKASGVLINEMLSTQSTAVDTVSGATFSSRGIIGAVRNALNQAGVLDSGSNASSTASSDNASKGEPTTPPLVANSKSTPPPVSEQTGATPPPVVNQKGTSSSSTAGQGGTSSSGTSKGQYKDGTYTGSGSGFGGTTKISVTISNGKIVSISTISNEDTSRYYNRAIGTITNSVISKQSASVDTVSGATYSSNGIIEAIRNALSQAK
ncbi:MULTISPECIES: FMN-binding protein [unclassified Clostridium]|uniref:FMN-binding protein n=1 Tax=unclassified Clostridium TaxID=2614128 RepID=UPI0002972BF8|nr:MULTISPECIES: FMN-binding protein [unclassified Clostridium]EKQ56552.1 MAG: FMN-binding protein [Clostridium sp. Maddingley MBC34-26]